VDQSSHPFSSNQGWVVVDDFRYLNPFSKHLRSKSKVDQNRPELSAREIIKLQVLKNVYPNFYHCFTAQDVGTFGDVIPTARPKVNRPDTLKFAPIFQFLLPPIFYRGHPIFST